MKIPFNKPFIAGKELAYIEDAVSRGKISGDGPYTQKCQKLLEELLSARKILLTTSGTAALEMTALLAELEPGDEVIMPSFTFVSTANAFLLRGAKPVFVDIRGDTLNLDETRIEEKVNPRTRAIVPVHYAGIACEMDAIIALARGREILVVEDAAQAIFSLYRGTPLGTIGDLGTLSFHETKNLISGEGGALIINNPRFLERAEIIWEKGTNRRKFFRGEIDKYTWVDLGSSYLMSDILAAYLYGQLEMIEKIQERREEVGRLYREQLLPLERAGKLRLPIVPESCRANHHLFYILLNSPEERARVMAGLRAGGIMAVFHYVPLHLSPMGKNFGYRKGDFPVTEDLSDRLLRLPLYYSLTDEEVGLVTDRLRKLF